MLVNCSEPATPAQKLANEQTFAQLVQMYPEVDLNLGRRVYLRQCSVCHQANGSGTGKAIPPLRGHITTLAAHPDGRGYLAHLVVFGLNGSIQINGQKYYNVMPTLGALLSDAEIASALNYAQLSWGNDASTTRANLVTQEDVRAVRGASKNGSHTLALRNALWPKGVQAPKLPEGPPPQ
jgi:mono/diheme cytochrome c family protein